MGSSNHLTRVAVSELVGSSLRASSRSLWFPCRSVTGLDRCSRAHCVRSGRMQQMQTHAGARFVRGPSLPSAACRLP